MVSRRKSPWSSFSLISTIVQFLLPTCHPNHPWTDRNLSPKLRLLIYDFCFPLAARPCTKFYFNFPLSLSLSEKPSATSCLLLRPLMPNSYFGSILLSDIRSWHHSVTCVQPSVLLKSTRKYGRRRMVFFHKTINTTSIKKDPQASNYWAHTLRLAHRSTFLIGKSASGCLPSIDNDSIWAMIWFICEYDKLEGELTYPLSNQYLWRQIKNSYAPLTHVQITRVARIVKLYLVNGERIYM